MSPQLVTIVVPPSSKGRPVEACLEALTSGLRGNFPGASTQVVFAAPDLSDAVILDSVFSRNPGKASDLGCMPSNGGSKLPRAESNFTGQCILLTKDELQMPGVVARVCSRVGLANEKAHRLHLQIVVL